MPMSFALCTSALLLGGLLATASAQVDAPRMQRDLRVAEGILRALIDSHSPASPARPRVRGVHIEDYGVVFLAEGSLSDRRVVEHVKRKWIDDEGRQHVVETQRGTSNGQAGAVAPVRAALSEFLSDYASAIDGLDDDERIAVLYRPMGAHPSGGEGAHIDVGVHVGPPGTEAGEIETELTIVKIDSDSSDPPRIDTLDARLPPGAIKRQIRVVIDTLTANGTAGSGELQALGALPDGAERPSPIAASARRADIDALRRGKIDSAAFAKRIQFDQPESSINKKIRIMAGIIATSLHRPGHSTRPNTAALGAYQPGLGAVFSLDMRPHPRRHSAPGHGPRHRTDDALAQWKQLLVESVGAYGATLRGVAPTESVFVDVRLPPEASISNHLLMQVKKSTIDAYTRGAIDRAALAKQATWRLY